jgi:hypothetical protein
MDLSSKVPSKLKSNGAFHVTTGTCSAKPHPADGQVAAFKSHVAIFLNGLNLS